MHPRRIVALVALMFTALLVAVPAAAHVTANPSQAAHGSFTKVAFRVPNERPDAETVKVEIQLPQDHPIPFVSTRALPGWEATVTMRTLDEPLEGEGESISEVVDTITWEGGSIAPGQFEEFEVSLGPIPEADVLVFPAIQTYDDGEEVAWIQESVEGEPEPDLPAPTITLVEGTGDHHDDGAGEATDPADGTTDADGTSAAPSDEVNAALDDLSDEIDDNTTLAQVGIAVGAIALIVSIAAIYLGRRTPDSDT